MLYILIILQIHEGFFLLFFSNCSVVYLGQYISADQTHIFTSLVIFYVFFCILSAETIKIYLSKNVVLLCTLTFDNFAGKTLRLLCTWLAVVQQTKN